MGTVDFKEVRGRVVAFTQEGSPAVAIGLPTPAQLMEVEGPFHWVWLKMLKASARNSKAMLSLIAKCLNSAMSNSTGPDCAGVSAGVPKGEPIGANAPGL